jgi:hypothetical protein
MSDRVVWRVNTTYEERKPLDGFLCALMMDARASKVLEDASQNGDPQG